MLNVVSRGKEHGATMYTLNSVVCTWWWSKCRNAWLSFWSGMLETGTAWGERGMRCSRPPQRTPTVLKSLLHPCLRLQAWNWMDYQRCSNAWLLWWWCHNFCFRDWWDYKQSLPDYQPSTQEVRQAIIPPGILNIRSRQPFRVTQVPYEADSQAVIQLANCSLCKQFVF